jgi:hypothetical protein
MIRAAGILDGLIRALSATAVGLVIVMLTGCATTEAANEKKQQMYVDWIAVKNPETVCEGKSSCVQKSSYKGKGLCTIITANKGLSYSRLGEQVRDCLN